MDGRILLGFVGLALEVLGILLIVSGSAAAGVAVLTIATLIVLGVSFGRPGGGGFGGFGGGGGAVGRGGSSPPRARASERGDGETMNDLPASVRMKEVGPRDGLQAEDAILSTEDKLRLIDCLADAGLRDIETSSFVHPEAIPPLADAAEVFANLERRPNVIYSAIVPNEKGAERAVEAGADEIQVFLAATEGYNQSNVKMSVEDSLEQSAQIAEIVQGADIPFVAVLSVAFGCPYEGPVAQEKVLELSGRLIELGAEEITYGDTTGMAYPTQVRDLSQAYKDCYPETPLRLHFHNTRGMGLANVLASLEAGIDRIDASVGGLGGSPYAAGATGNISTEDLVHMLHEMGIETGIDLEALIGCAQLLEALLEHELPGQVMKAGICGHLTEGS